MDPLPEIRTHPWHSREHHRPEGGFQNIWSSSGGGSFYQGMKWFFSRALHSKENIPPPVHPIDPSSLRAAPNSIRFTWMGHASVLIQTGTRTILLDPMLGERASPFSFAGPKRVAPIPIVARDLPPLDAVVFSHDHYDHLDRGTVEELIALQNPVFLAPLGAAQRIRSWGSRRVLEMDWWQYADLDGVRYHCLPAKHFSGRGLRDRDATLWAGWLMETEAVRIFYLGDTAYASHFRQVRERLGRPDVALVPIGAYEPQWLMHPVHMRPDEAMDAFRDLEAEHFIPVHWGTFDLADEPVQEPAEKLHALVEAGGLHDRVHVLEIGASWVL